MKSAYLYIRVSTDEQKRQGYSLVEQEERLLEHCQINSIQVIGVFREDHSAKDFNRPEWKKLIKILKKNKSRSQIDILFLKWDRFSRNIQYAYQMIGLLRDLGVQAMAVDQPIDFEVPESIVMLAVYLSIPEAENSRRGKNTSDGMRRARKLARWPGKAPIGYTNLTSPEGKKFIAPKQPEADHIRWSFQQFVTGAYSISQVRKMACLNGFKCQRNNFWRLLRNPVYCGVVTLSAIRDEEKQYIKGAHEPLISEELFQAVQSLLKSRCRQKVKKDRLKHLFPLKGFLTCPYCDQKLTGSTSSGRRSKYRYYHCCSIRCKGRFRADELEMAYEQQLKNIWITPAAIELFQLVLEDENILTARKYLLDERQIIHKEISKEQSSLAKARRLFIEDKIDEEDFGSVKKDLKEKLNYLSERITEVDQKINHNKINTDSDPDFTCSDILFSYKNQDIAGKRSIINLFPPSSINPVTKNLNPVCVNPSVAQIIHYKQQSA